MCLYAVHVHVCMCFLLCIVSHVCMHTCRCLGLMLGVFLLSIAIVYMKTVCLQLEPRACKFASFHLCSSLLLCTLRLQVSHHAYLVYMWLLASERWSFPLWSHLSRPPNCFCMQLFFCCCIFPYYTFEMLRCL